MSLGPTNLAPLEIKQGQTIAERYTVVIGDL